MIFIYNILLFIALVLASPFFFFKSLITGKYRRNIRAKLGLVNLEHFLKVVGFPRILVHAVSVGEVTVAAPIITQLRGIFPNAAIFLSTTTETGREMAEKIATAADCLFYAPLDIPCAVSGMLTATRPDVLVLVEAELWPNLLNICHKRGIKIILVNGRISPRSFHRYLFIHRLWQTWLSGIDKAGAISLTDAARLARMGIPCERIVTIGNAKNDALATRTSVYLQEEMAAKLSFGKNERVFVAGSTHEGEETLVLETFKQLLKRDGRFKLIITPRHPQRANAVKHYAEQAGFSDVVFFSALAQGEARGERRIVIVDIIGELFKIYALAEFVFCGGSLVPKGGQNILEAAAWGNVVLYGRHMDDFLQEKNALEEVGAGICVADGRELTKRVLELLDNPTELAQRRERAREVIIAGMGAARRYAELVATSLDNWH